MTAVRLLDTSVWIRALGAHAVPRVRDLVQGIVERHEAATCTPVAFELLRGVPDPGEFDELLDYLMNLNSLPVDWVGAARWAASPAIRSLKVKSMDLVIAHTALANGAVLVHADSDFDRLARSVQLKVESLAGVSR
ncbi:MAG: PIN domain-containing protein [Candidatus Coatesbacteria bacterium]